VAERSASKKSETKKIAEEFNDTAEPTGETYADLDEDLAELLIEVDEELSEKGGETQAEAPAVPETAGKPDEPVSEEATEVTAGEPTEPAESTESTPDDPPTEPAPAAAKADAATKKSSPRAKTAAPSTTPAKAASIKPVSAAKDEKPAVPEATPRLGWWTRFTNWLFRKPAVMHEEAVPEETPPAARDFEKELKRKTAALNKAQKIRAREAQEAEKLQTRLETQQEELERVRIWVEGLERSYFWNVQKRMTENLNKAKADLAFFEHAVENVILPERGDLIVLRQRFHKALGVGLLSFGIPTALLFAIPWFAQATMPVWLLEFLNSQFFSILVGGLLALTAGIVGLVRRAIGKERMNWWRMIRIVASVVSIPLLVFGVARAQEWLLVYGVPFIERWRATALIVLGIGFFFYLMTILIIYYAGWSVFSRQVTEQLTALENVEQGYVDSQKEIRRLEALYEQTSDWLQLLAHSLYRPWKIDPDWLGTKQLKLTSETFPFALRVAHAVDSETSQVANLERLIGQRLMTQGWRNEAFEDTLAQIGHQMGFDETHVTPEFLDADLPHQTNNSRALIRQFFEQSAVTAEKGKPEMVDTAGPTKAGHARFSDNYLVEVARKRLRELIEKTQASVLSEARPSVEQIVEDPLQEIKFDSSGIDSRTTALDWDDFLRDALGYEDIVQPPLSTMTFTDEGALSKDPDSAETHILIPERLKASAPKPGSESIRIHPLADNTTGRSVELIVRFDVVGPVPFDHVKMVENATQRVVAPDLIDDDNSEL